MRARESRRLRWALAASVLAHAGGMGLFWYATTVAEEMPPMRVYAVDIVSPPPQLQGEPDPGGGGVPEPVEEAPEAEPEPETPPAQPAPTPPAEAPREREPSPPPPPTKTPPAEKPAPAKTEPPKEEEKEEPAKTPAPRPGGGSGEGSGASRGNQPDPSSSGGENIDEHLRGVQCPSPAYCANIVRQLYRYFRPPSGSSGDAVEVFFWINRDGSAAEMRVVRSSGSYRFQLAALEAVEQAGNNKAFGALPRAFELDRLPVSFYFRPAR